VPDASLPPVTVVPVPGVGAEDVVVDDEGRVFTGTADGAVWCIEDEGARIRRVGHTGGRPLGLELLHDGRLLVCDGEVGLLALDPGTGSVETLATEANGKPILVCNNAAVAADGTVYFSDSSAVHPLSHWRADLAEDTRSGRLLRRDPDGSIETLAEGLRFANGVALAGDESAVYVAESTSCDVVRVHLSGPRVGSRDFLAADLPGHPDNIARGTDGLVWVTIASPRVRALPTLHRAPRAVRRAVTRIPERLQPSPGRQVRVVALGTDGHVVHDCERDSSDYHMVTGVREHRGRVWLGSLEEAAVAFFDL
jgi:sugar lactone lactonase YvrE